MYIRLRLPRITISGSIFLLCIYHAVCLNAQQADWSPYETTSNKNPYIRIAGQDKEGFYVLRSNLSFELPGNRKGFKNRKFIASYYNFQMNKKWEKKIEPAEKKARTEAIAFANNRLLIINLHTEEQGDKYRLSVTPLGNKGTYEAQSVKIDEGQGKVDNMETVVSLDRSKTACLYTVTYPESDKQVLKLCVINERMQASTPVLLKTSSFSKNFNLADFTVSNDGRIFLLEAASKNEKRSKEMDFNSFTLYSYDSLINVFTEKKIELDRKYITDIWLSFDNRNNRLTMVGFFSEKTNYSTAGIFFINRQEGMPDNLDIHTEEFRDEFIDKFIGERKTIEGKELMNYSISNVFLKADGGVVLTAEAGFLSEYSYYDIFTQSYIVRTIYNYNNILVISVDKEGKMEWEDVIDKTQSSSEDGGYYLSYCTLVYYGKLHFFFNQKKEKRNEVHMNSVSNNNTKDHHILFKGYENTTLIPKGAKQVAANIIIIPALRNKRLSFLKLTF